MYGLLFVWSTNNQDELGYDSIIQPMLAANTVTLGVLAPVSDYEGYELTNLDSALNNGLDQFGEQNSVAMSFELCELGADYSPDLEPEHVRSAIRDRNRIWVAASN